MWSEDRIVAKQRECTSTPQAQRRKPISAIRTPVSKPRSGAVVTAPTFAPRATSRWLFVGGCGVGFLRAAFWAGRAALSPPCHGAIGPWLRTAGRRQVRAFVKKPLSVGRATLAQSTDDRVNSVNTAFCLEAIGLTIKGGTEFRDESIGPPIF